MADIIIRAGSFVFIIFLGWFLKKIGFFKQEDFTLLSRITLRITLPCACIVSFSGMQIDPALLVLVLLALGCGFVYIGCGVLMGRKAGRQQQAFEMLNLAGYNIGAFVIPFAQSFLGAAGVVAAGIFDVGNAVIVLGGAFSLACMVRDGSGFSFKRLGKSLATSVPFVVYVIMMILNLSHIALPKPVLSAAGIIGNANAFMAMLMIGVGFRLEASPTQIKTLARMLLVRYGLGVVFALLFYYALPFALEVRQALVILAFAPIGSAVPGFTGEMKGDVGLSSALNSLSIVISIVIIVALLFVML